MLAAENDHRKGSLQNDVNDPWDRPPDGERSKAKKSTNSTIPLSSVSFDSIQSTSREPSEPLSDRLQGRVTKKRSSQGGKRKLKPAPLDMEALRRHRQVLGPLSASPPLKTPVDQPSNPPRFRLPRISELSSGASPPPSWQHFSPLSYMMPALQGPSTQDKRAQFLKLCGEMWDLMHG